MVKRIKKIEPKQLTTVRLTSKQRKIIDASARLNNVSRTRVISESINSYFNLM